MNWKELFSSSLQTLSEITDGSGRKLIHSPRKRAFLVLLLTFILSHIFLKLLLKAKSWTFCWHIKPLRTMLNCFFVLFEGDLEQTIIQPMFLGTLNPTSDEFKSAYKRLLVHHQIKGNRGNSIVQDDSSVLQISAQKVQSEAKSKENDICLEKIQFIVWKWWTWLFNCFAFAGAF